MADDTNKIIDEIKRIGDDQGLRVAIKESGKGAAVVAGVTFASAIFFGPIGILAGGVAGGALGYAMTNKFKTLSQVLNDMSSSQKKNLVNRVKEEVEEKVGSKGNVVKLLQNDAIKTAVLTTVLHFITNVLGLETYQSKR